MSIVLGSTNVLNSVYFWVFLNCTVSDPLWALMKVREFKRARRRKRKAVGCIFKDKSGVGMVDDIMQHCRV